MLPQDIEVPYLLSFEPLVFNGFLNIGLFDPVHFGHFLSGHKSRQIGFFCSGRHKSPLLPGILCKCSRGVNLKRRSPRGGRFRGRKDLWGSYPLSAWGELRGLFLCGFLCGFLLGSGFLFVGSLCLFETRTTLMGIFIPELCHLLGDR